MTDTQEGMREEFEAACPRYKIVGGAIECYFTDDEYEAAWEGYQAATAQSAEKISRLEAEAAAQEKLIRILKGALSVAVTKEMVDRFLVWKLPKGFCPDAGISFNPTSAYDSPHWPVGTNLFTAEQAQEMLEHILADEMPLPPAPEQKVCEHKFEVDPGPHDLPELVGLVCVKCGKRMPS